LFPNEYAGNVYRFMDARDGFNYGRSLPPLKVSSTHEKP
jgi:hypothetical protein